ncbi:MAG: hypothetical protein LBH54_05805 [Clostridiales bacterium]|nr:hypothetical protein [Clostridiales bacterium]
MTSNQSTRLKQPEDFRYQLELTENHLQNPENHAPYTAYGVRLVHNGAELLDYKDVDFNQARLRRYLRLIAESEVPYYHINDLIEDYICDRNA